MCLGESKIVCGCTLTNHAHLLLIRSKDAVQNANHVEKNKQGIYNSLLE